MKLQELNNAGFVIHSVVQWPIAVFHLQGIRFWKNSYFHVINAVVGLQKKKFTDRTILSIGDALFVLYKTITLTTNKSRLRKSHFAAFANQFWCTCEFIFRLENVGWPTISSFFQVRVPSLRRASLGNDWILPSGA